MVWSLNQCAIHCLKRTSILLFHTHLCVCVYTYTLCVCVCVHLYIPVCPRAHRRVCVCFCVKKKSVSIHGSQMYEFVDASALKLFRMKHSSKTADYYLS